MGSLRAMGVVFLLASTGACADEGAAVDAGSDRGPLDGGGVDGGSVDAGVEDAGSADGNELDAGGSDGGGPATSCTGAGGACVPVVPGACSAGIVGNADWYSCGGGLGVMCCLPLTTPPLCRLVGSRSEGWYRPDGTRICFADCNGHVATCEAVGTRSEGWYADAVGAGCETIPVERLIEWTMCAP